MIELLLWPLLPFIGLWRKPGEAAAPSQWEKSSVWVGVALGGVGWAVNLLKPAVSWLPWLATGVTWAAASAYIVWNRGEEWRDHAETQSEGATLDEKVRETNKEHAALREELARLEKQENRSLQIYGLAKSLTESLSWDGLLSRFSRMLQNLTGASDFLLYLVSGAGKMELKLKSGAWPKDVGENASRDPRHPEWIPNGSEKLLHVPLWQGESPIGRILVRWNNSEEPSVKEIEDMFGPLSTGFQKAQLFSRMESLSRIDGLTGVLRRQVFLEHVQEEWNRCRMFGTRFCFMLVDVDHFKNVNDTHGHPAGDAVLSRLGALLREGIYETDFVGRYGGEEFGILLPRAEPEGVRRKAESLRKRIEKEEISIGWEKLRITISIGLGHYPRDGKTVETVMEAADKALYFAKESGRNRVADSSDLK